MAIKIKFNCAIKLELDQAYSRLSTTHCHITDCKLDSVVHAGVCMCRCGELIWTCLVWAGRTTPASFLFVCYFVCLFVCFFVCFLMVQLDTPYTTSY